MWYVDVIRDGEYIHCSTHDNREDAVGAYNDFRRTYGDEYIVTIYSYDEE